MVEQGNLDYLREEMQNITNQIIKLVHDRMEVEFSGRLLNLLLSESVKLQNVQNSSNKSSTHIAIFMKAKELEKTGKKIIHMEVGEPDYPPPLKVKEELAKIYDNKRYHYTEISGLSQLRQAISKKF